MNFTMRPCMRRCRCLQPRGGVKVRFGDLSIRTVSRNFQVLWCHTDHDCLLFLRIEQFYYTTLDKIVPFVVAVLVVQLINMLLRDRQLLVFHNKERSAHTTGVRVQSQFPLPNVSYYRDFRANIILPTELLDGLHQVRWITVHAHPHTVDEYLCTWCRGVSIFFQGLQPPLFQELDDGRG